jgi:Flp pilus assembly protein TadG
MMSEKGQSLVEFALVLPVLIFLLLGIVDFGRAFHAYLTIDHAGREAARAASIGKDVASTKIIARDNGGSIGLTIDMVEVYPKSPTSNDVTIFISYPITFITPALGVIAEEIGFDKLEDTTVMRVE